MDVVDWDHEDADLPTKFALIHSEISEALEAYRNPKWEVTKTYADISGVGDCWIEYDKAIVNSRKPLKPEGFPSELADVVIRCADLAGAKGWRLEESPRPVVWNDRVGANLQFLHETLDDAISYSESEAISEVVNLCFSLAGKRGIDLWHEIDHKTKYNATRSARHGGRRA